MIHKKKLLSYLLTRDEIIDLWIQRTLILRSSKCLKQKQVRYVV